MSVDLGQDLILPGASQVLKYRSNEAWRDARSTYLGASNGAKVLGLSPYGGGWSVRESKLGLRERKQTADMSRGLQEERRILEDYGRATGHRVVGPLGPVVIVAHEPWMGCTPDAFVHDTDTWGLGECKIDQSNFPWGPSGLVVDSWSEEVAALIREDYALQCYLQMAWTGLPWCALIVRRSLRDLRWYVLRRDVGLEASVMPLLRSYWQDVIEGGELPDVDDSAACARAMARIWPEGKKRSAPATPSDLGLVASRIRVKAEQKQAEETWRGIDNELMARMAASDVHRLDLPADAGLGSRVTWVCPAGKKPHILIK